MYIDCVNSPVLHVIIVHKMYGTEKIMILLKSYSFRDSELCRIVRKLQFVRCGRYIIGLNEFSVCAVNEASVC